MAWQIALFEQRGSLRLSFRGLNDPPPPYQIKGEQLDPPPPPDAPLYGVAVRRLTDEESDRLQEQGALSLWNSTLLYIRGASKGGEAEAIAVNDSSLKKRIGIPLSKLVKQVQRNQKLAQELQDHGVQWIEPHDLMKAYWVGMQILRKSPHFSGKVHRSEHDLPRTLLIQGQKLSLLFNRASQGDPSLGITSLARKHIRLFADLTQGELGVVMSFPEEGYPHLLEEVHFLKYATLLKLPHTLTLLRDPLLAPSAKRQCQKWYLQVPLFPEGDLESRMLHLDSAQKYHIAKRLLVALAAFHREHFLHRDLKPSNIFLKKGGLRGEVFDPYIGDLGSCCLFERHERREEMEGTIPYLPPEFFPTLSITSAKERGQALAKIHAAPFDIWSMGCIFYELFCGPLPWFPNREIPPSREEMQKRFEELEPVEVWVTHSKGELQEVLRAMLALDPGTRISAEEALKRFPQKEDEEDEKEET